MAERPIKPALKQALELGPVILFFAGFFLLKGETYTVLGHEMPKFILLTGLFVPMTIIATGLLWLLTGSLNRMQVFTLVLVIVLGGASVWLNDPRFIKMKPTLLYLAFSGILAYGLLRGKSYLGVLMGGSIPLTEAGWLILTRRFAGFFFGLAIANEIVWRTMSDGTWLSFKLFGVTGAIFVFFMAQFLLLQPHMIPQEDDKTPKA